MKYCVGITRPFEHKIAPLSLSVCLYLCFAFNCFLITKQECTRQESTLALWARHRRSESPCSPFCLIISLPLLKLLSGHALCEQFPNTLRTDLRLSLRPHLLFPIKDLELSKDIFLKLGLHFSPEPPINFLGHGPLHCGLPMCDKEVFVNSYIPLSKMIP